MKSSSSLLFYLSASGAHFPIFFCTHNDTLYKRRGWKLPLLPSCWNGSNPSKVGRCCPFAPPPRVNILYLHVSCSWWFIALNPATPDNTKAHHSYLLVHSNSDILHWNSEPLLQHGEVDLELNNDKQILNNFQMNRTKFDHTSLVQQFHTYNLCICKDAIIKSASLPSSSVRTMNLSLKGPGAMVTARTLIS